MNHTAKILLAITGVIIVGTIVLSALADLFITPLPHATAEKKAEEEQPLLDIEASELVRTYESNEVAADQLYRNKELIVRGQVEAVDEVSGSVYVILRGQAWDVASIRNVQCLIRPDAQSSTIALRKGKYAAIRGTCEGMGLNVELKACIALQ